MGREQRQKVMSSAMRQTMLHPGLVDHPVIPAEAGIAEDPIRLSHVTDARVQPLYWHSWCATKCNLLQGYQGRNPAWNVKWGSCRPTPQMHGL